VQVRPPCTLSLDHAILMREEPIPYAFRMEMLAPQHDSQVGEKDQPFLTFKPSRVEIPPRGPVPSE